MGLGLKVVGLLVGALLFFAVAGVVATWAPDKPVSEPAPRWARPPSQFVQVQGMQVHLRDEGPGAGAPMAADAPAPIVLLHGTSCRPGSMTAGCNPWRRHERSVPGPSAVGAALAG